MKARDPSKIPLTFERYNKFVLSLFVSGWKIETAVERADEIFEVSDTSF